MLQKLSAETNAINWFEIPVTDMKRAQQFYEQMLDIELAAPEKANPEEDMMFFPRKADTIMAQSGIVSGALVKGERLKPASNGVLIYLNASPSVQAACDKVEAAGGKIVMPVTKIPAGLIAVIIDSEGNKVGIHSAE